MARTVWRPFISGLPSAAPQGARTVWRLVISGLPSAAPKGARKSRVCAEAYIGTAELALSLLNGRSVEIGPACAAAEGLSGDLGCGPAAQGGKGHLPDGN